jgi:hypothetical protein
VGVSPAQLREKGLDAHPTLSDFGIFFYLEVPKPAPVRPIPTKVVIDVGSGTWRGTWMEKLSVASPLEVIGPSVEPAVIVSSWVKVILPLASSNTPLH